MVAGIIRRPRTDSKDTTTDRPTERDRDRDGRAETVGYSDSPTPLLRAVAAAAAAAAAAHGAHQIPPAPTAFCCQDAGGPRSFRAASPSSRPTGSYLRLSGDQGARGEERRARDGCACCRGSRSLLLLLLLLLSKRRGSCGCRLRCCWLRGRNTGHLYYMRSVSCIAEPTLLANV